MTAGSRKLIGSLALMAGLFVYVMVVAWIGSTYLHDSPVWQLLFYGIAGIAWALPLRPFMAWMNRPDEE